MILMILCSFTDRTDIEILIKRSVYKVSILFIFFCGRIKKSVDKILQICSILGSILSERT